MRRSLAPLAAALGLFAAGCCCPRTTCAPSACAPSVAAAPRHDPCASSPSIERASGERIPVAPPAVEPAGGAPYNETCPVMLGNPVDPKITTTWNGKIVGFCSEGCRARFVKDPQKYEKNLP